MAKLTIEEAQNKLDKLLAKTDNLSNAFHMGRVGFRKHTKRYLYSIDKSIDDALEIVRLRQFIEYQKNNPENLIVKNKYYESTNEMIKGEKYFDSSFGLITVVKINKNTVTIQTDSGYTETRKPSLIYKK